MQERPNLFKLTLSSEATSINELEPFLQRLSKNRVLSDNQYHDILLCLTEAVTNGIRHGNENDPSKKVSIEGEVSGQQIQFKISDEGHGFDPKKVPDPTDERNICEPCGRGVHIMKSLADFLDYSEKGRTVHLKFRCG